MTEGVKKTYIVTDKLSTPFPEQFINSTNKRYIEIQNVQFFDVINNAVPDDVFMHVNFIHEKWDHNNLVAPANVIQTAYKTLPFNGNDEELKLWFSKIRPSYPVSTDVAEPQDPDLFEDFDFRTVPDFDDMELLRDAITVLLGPTVRALTNDRMDPDDILRIPDLKTKLEAIEGNYPLYFSDERNKQGIRDLLKIFDDYSTMYYLFFIEATDRIIDWYENVIVFGGVPYSPALGKLPEFILGDLQYVLDLTNDFNIDKMAQKLISYVNGDLKRNALAVDIEDFLNIWCYFIDAIGLPIEIQKRSLYLHFIMNIDNRYIKLFEPTEDSYQDFLMGYTLASKYFNLGIRSDVLADAIHLCLQITNTKDIAAVAGHFGVAYALDFGSTDLNILRSYFFAQLCGILSGIKQEPLNWCSMDNKFDMEMQYVLQKARDPLTGKTLNRTVAYDTNSIIQYGNPILKNPVSMAFDFSTATEPDFCTIMHLIRICEYICVKEMIKIWIEDTPSITADEYRELVADMESYMDSIGYASKLRDLILDIMRANIPKPGEPSTVMCDFCNLLASWFHREIINNNIRDNANAFAALNIIKNSFDINMFFVYLVEYDEVMNQYVNEDFKIIRALICLNLYDPSKFVLHDLIELYKEHFIIALAFPDFFALYVYMLDKLKPIVFNEANAYMQPAMYSVMRSYNILYANKNKLSKLEPDLLMILLIQCIYQEPIKNILANLGPEYYYYVNFTTSDREIEYQMYLRQLLEVLDGEIQYAEVWTEVSRTENEQGTVITEEAHDTLTNELLYRVNTVPKYGVPIEQFDWSDPVNPSLNYRFFAEFMLIF